MNRAWQIVERLNDIGTGFMNGIASLVERLLFPILVPLLLLELVIGEVILIWVVRNNPSVVLEILQWPHWPFVSFVLVAFVLGILWAKK